MSPIPEGTTRNWTVFIDGAAQQPGEIKFVSKYGVLHYGQRPEGYESWVFFEHGGGGAVTIPYTHTPEGDLVVGLIYEQRPNMSDKPSLCVIGGMLDPGENHAQAQSREAAEESGLDTMAATELPGDSINSNRLFFVTDTRNDKGVHLYGLKIPFEMLEQRVGEKLEWGLKNSILIPGFKKADDVCFFLWRKAVLKTSDALALAALTRLIIMEHEKK